MQVEHLTASDNKKSIGILQLNYDCLWVIFDLLPLKDQLVIHDVHPHFGDVITNMLKNHFKNSFDAIWIQRNENLNPTKTEKMLEIVKPFVNHLTLEKLDHLRTRDTNCIWHLNTLEICSTCPTSISMASYVPFELFDMEKLKNFRLKHWRLSDIDDIAKILSQCPLESLEYSESVEDFLCCSALYTFNDADYFKNNLPAITTWKELKETVLEQELKKVKLITFCNALKICDTLEVLKLNVCFIVPEVLNEIIDLPLLKQFTIFTDVSNFGLSSNNSVESKKTCHETVCEILLHNLFKVLSEKKSSQIVAFNMRFSNFLPKYLELLHDLPNLTKFAWSSFLISTYYSSYLQWFSFDKILLYFVLKFISCNKKLNFLDFRHNRHITPTFIARVNTICSRRFAGNQENFNIIDQCECNENALLNRKKLILKQLLKISNFTAVSYDSKPTSLLSDTFKNETPMMVTKMSISRNGLLRIHLFQ